MAETDSILQKNIGLQSRLNAIMGYLRQIDPIKFNNQTTASKALNVVRTNLSAALNGDSRYLKSDSPVINAIFSNFPELSKEWFLNESGEMLKSKERNEIESTGRISPGVMTISVDEFDKLPANKQLTLLWQAIQLINESLEKRLDSQDEKIIKAVDFIDEKVTPMYEFMKLSSKQK